jgi:cyclopropane-fatty-acyl-phospholipid synthase
MLEKRIFDLLLRRIKNGGVRVVYPDGSRVNYGPDKPYFTMKFKNPEAIRAILKNQSLGLGEGYMSGDVKIDGPLDNIVRLVAENKAAFKGFSLHRLTSRREKNIAKEQKRQIQHHYDLGNDFYKLWLDKSMTYTCAYFKSPKDSLEKAQLLKIDHVLGKLQLKRGQTLLDIGCGWGQLLMRAAEKYNVKAYGVTLSEEQFRHATAEAKRRKLDNNVTFELVNYQELLKRDLMFDRIVSVGFYEAVGKGNAHTYFKVLDKLLKDDGISVLHTITQQKEVANDPWIDKYIFPGGYIPSLRETIDLLPDYNFRLLDYENLRPHYAKTLDEWWRRFENNKSTVIRMFDSRFYRMWRFWLAASSASFRYGDLDLSQLVFSKGVNNKLPITRQHLY